MKMALKVAACTAAMIFSQAAFAASGSWTRTATLQYLPVSPLPGQEVHGSYHSGYQITPAGARITTVSWVANAYPNGATQVLRRLCYTPPSTANYTVCVDITNTPTGTTSAFAGLDAFKYFGGRFDIVYTLSGGTYSVSTTLKNTVTVNCTY